MSWLNFKTKVISWLEDSTCILYPDIFETDMSLMCGNLDRLSEESRLQLIQLLTRVQVQDPEKIAHAFMESLPEIKASIETDIEAAFSNDPSAKSKEEILLAFPGVQAMSIHRFAHRLYHLDVPILPRLLSEHAHSLTGIDIHPGATIGDYCFIDHGTGLVIGETSVIGHHCVLFHGVTMGILSPEYDENGDLIRQGKRHPDLGNYVTLYANATILGKDTFIGDHSVIGASVFITRSVPEYSQVTQEQGQLHYKKLKNNN